MVQAKIVRGAEGGRAKEYEEAHYWFRRAFFPSWKLMTKTKQKLFFSLNIYFLPKFRNISVIAIAKSLFSVVIGDVDNDKKSFQLAGIAFRNEKVSCPVVSIQEEWRMHPL